MTIDYFKHSPELLEENCVEIEEVVEEEEEKQDNNSIKLDTSSYVKYFNQFISDEFDKLNETRKQYYGDEIAVVQPYLNEEKEKSKNNCLTVDKEGLSFQDCRLDKSQTWIPSNKTSYC